MTRRLTAPRRGRGINVCIVFGLLGALTCTAVTAPRAVAAEVCVTCVEPLGVYRCQVDGVPLSTAGSAAANLVCLKELARSGGHAQCSVARGGGGECPGELVIVTAPPGAIPVAPPTAAATVPAGGPGSTAALSPTPAETAQPGPGTADAVAEEAPPPRRSGPPRTVEELAKRTAEDSTEGLKKAGEAVTGVAKTTAESIGKAGEAVGSAAKKTWDCIATLLKDC